MEQAEQIGVWDGFDDAIVGVAERCGQPPLVVYDRERMIQILSREMTVEDAEEHLECNIAGAWLGVLTPMIMHKVPSRTRLKSSLMAIEQQAAEVTRLRNALVQIAEHRDEPYSAEFAKDILERREV